MASKGAPANGGMSAAAAAATTTAPAPSVDAILSRHARHMQPGQTLTLTLVKGATSQSTDPRFALAASLKKRPAGVTNKLDFPRVAKFVETVQKPDFGGRFAGGRLYEEDIPEVKVCLPRAYRL